MKEKIYNLLKKQNNVKNFIIYSLIFVIMACITKLFAFIILITDELKYDLLIVNSVENIEKFHNYPITQEQINEIFIKISNDLQPIYYIYLFFIFIALICFILAVYKLIRRE